jgi:molybdate transport system substrate-binding protein
MADIKVLSTHAVQEVLREFAPEFERTNGVRLAVEYDPANALKRRIEDGAVFDVAIVTRPVIDDLIGAGKVVGALCADIGRSGLGISVRKGAPKPDIATVEAFKRTLLDVKSIARSREGTSGVYFETLLTHLGIAGQMRGKIILGGSGRVARLVALGEAEMAIQQIPELLPVGGTEFAGPLPQELQLYTLFSAGVAEGAKNRVVAERFIDRLKASGSSALLRSKGLEPIPR